MTAFVLVHGAYQGGWIWRLVAERLRKAGHDAFTPTLDGCAEHAGSLRPGITNTLHAKEIAQLLFYEDLQDVVLVGTSCGGMVMSEAAEMARPRIARLVFADALRSAAAQHQPAAAPSAPRRRRSRRALARDRYRPLSDAEYAGRTDAHHPRPLKRAKPGEPTCRSPPNTCSSSAWT